MANGVSFIAELKRRNVFRAAILYVGAVWALAQGIAQLSGPFGLEDWVTRWFVVACAIAFPFWLVGAWYFEFTWHGIKREREIADAGPADSTGSRKLDFVIIGVLVVAVALLASGYFIHRESPGKGGASGPFRPPADSLVVLPFKNMSGDPKQQYFSDGITEELTGALGQNPGLRVIAWDTASKFRNSEADPHQVGRNLNVANILHGSILRAGDQVRVTAELVSAVSGYVLWSSHYDGLFSDIFKMQDKVSEAIAGALKVKFAQTDLPKGGTTNPQAHDLVLKGRALLDKGDAASLTEARRNFEQAIATDANYADAHALLSRALLDLTQRSDLPLKATLPTVRAEAEKALSLDSRNADAWSALGNAEASGDPPDLTRARADYRQALILDPSNVAAHLDYGNVLPLKPALAEEQEATRLDPANQIAQNNLAAKAQDLGDWPTVIEAAGNMIKLDPTNVDSAFFLFFAYQQTKQYDKMVAAFDLVKPSNPVDQQQAATGKLVAQALSDSKLRQKAAAALEGLSQHTSNPDVASNMLPMYLALGDKTRALKLLQSFCPADPVGCNDLGVSPMYKPLSGNPAFDALSKKYTTITVE